MDGIEGLRSLPRHSVDMLLTDPPYGTTRNFWDVPLPLPELWEAVKWAVKPEGAVLFFAQCPYDKVLGTIIVKVLVYPATYKSYMSSAKMRVLKPYINEINAKYPKKEDALKKQQETMALYSKYGVSPMGGCLPMLIQMPVFMALFFFVPNAIELRQQSFLWAPDLSTYDDIINWGTNIPLLGNHLSLFCLLFSITNILNTMYTMKQQDMGQHRIILTNILV